MWATPYAKGGNYRPPLRQGVRRRPSPDPRGGDGDNSPPDDGRGTKRNSRPPYTQEVVVVDPHHLQEEMGTVPQIIVMMIEGTLHEEEAVMVENSIHPWVVVVVAALLTHQEGEDPLILKGPPGP